MLGDILVVWVMFVVLMEIGICVLDVEIVCLIFGFIFDDWLQCFMEIVVCFGVGQVLVVGNDDNFQCSVDNFVIFVVVGCLFGLIMNFELMFWIQLCNIVVV